MSLSICFSACWEEVRERHAEVRTVRGKRKHADGLRPTRPTHKTAQTHLERLVVVVEPALQGLGAPTAVEDTELAAGIILRLVELGEAARVLDRPPVHDKGPHLAVGVGHHDLHKRRVGGTL